jgi:GNAT superfamily N-acetyltransferase
MSIRYQTSLDGIDASMLSGFFVGWPHPPSSETHYDLLAGSDVIVLAIDEETDRVIGFVTAITDGVLCAYLPLLEVLPDYQKRGIGSELVRRILKMLRPLYMIDLVCDDRLVGFYERFGLWSATAMCQRDFDSQAGRSR